MAPSGKDVVFVGVGGHVVAVDGTTGAELWRTKLKGATLTTLLVRGGRIYGGANGELFCLDASTGEILWHNKLKGLGTGIVAFSASAADTGMAAHAAAAAAMSAAT
ncbi:MAG TPA: PQQ-binding-like beta-propeller repeat protein [Gemmatimonadales bacterium]|nr:PQQ-binding-like beta-propeller repeat protein [Gemmatimonadales bacterium]